MSTNNPLLKLDKSPLVQQDSLALRKWLAAPERRHLERILRTRASDLMLSGAAAKMGLAKDQVGHIRADVDFAKAQRLMECLNVLTEISNEEGEYLVGTPNFT